MMSVLKIYLIVFFILVAEAGSAQVRFKTIIHDFEKVCGSWTGSLTYLDYSSGKPYTMPANKEIYRIDRSNRFINSNLYPNETGANSTDTIVISTDGNYINQELIKYRNKLANGVIEIITEESGKDGNDQKPALFKYTYTLGKEIFKKSKEVRFADGNAWIKRHEYSYTRKRGEN